MANKIPEPDQEGFTKKHGIGGWIMVEPYPNHTKGEAWVIDQGFQILERRYVAGMTILTVYGAPDGVTIFPRITRYPHSYQFNLFHMKEGIPITPYGIASGRTDIRVFDRNGSFLENRRTSGG